MQQRRQIEHSVSQGCNGRASTAAIQSVRYPPNSHVSVRGAPESHDEACWSNEAPAASSVVVERLWYLWPCRLPDLIGRVHHEPNSAARWTLQACNVLWLCR